MPAAKPKSMRFSVNFEDDAARWWRAVEEAIPKSYPPAEQLAVVDLKKLADLDELYIEDLVHAEIMIAVAKRLPGWDDSRPPFFAPGRAVRKRR